MSRIIRLQAEGFKRLLAVDYTPGPHVNRIGGNNEEGKTSLLDAIYAAIGGADAAPLKPVRTGADFAIIKVDIGESADAIELRATRYFEPDGFESLKLENADGATYGAAQTKLNDLIGSISFDPLAFANMDDKTQVAQLLRIVPLEVDLADLAAKDKADFAERRDINRDAKAVKARFEAIPIDPDLPEERPDRAAILAELESAAETNSAIERERAAREARARNVEEGKARCERIDADIRELEARIATLREEGAEIIASGLAEMRAIEALPPLGEPVDTAAVRARLAEAEELGARFDSASRRRGLFDEFEAMRLKSEALTAAMVKREEERAKALSEAAMPIEGLSLATIEDELRVTFNGEPFSQSSGAQRIRVSTALAIAANPKLRVCLIDDAEKLDKNNLAVIHEMAKANNFQIFLAGVGEEGAGVIIHAGKVKGAPDPEKLEPPKRRKKGATEAEAGENLGAGDPVTIEGGKATKAKPGAMSEFVTKPAGELDL